MCVAADAAAVLWLAGTEDQALPPMEHAPSSRTAELLGALSLATDAAAGFAPETAVRTSVIAVRLGRAAGLSPDELRDCYYAGLLRYLGCTGYAHEQAGVNGGDDIGFLQIYADADLGSPAQMISRTLKSLGAGQSPVRRAVLVARFLADPGGGTKISAAHCGAAATLASRMGMTAGVRTALDQMYERWDGSGAPNKIGAGQLSGVSKVLHAAQVLEVFLRLGGIARAKDEVTRRSGRHLDPALAALAAKDLPEIAAGLSVPSVFDLFCDSEPPPVAQITPGDVPKIALAFANFADLKSIYMLGHSPLVSDLCRAAAPALGLNRAEAADIAIAGLLHDLGRVSVPSGIWDKPSALTPHELDRVRAHPAVLARVMGRTGALRPLADLASAAYERLDGSGYPRRIGGAALGRGQRLLAAADVFTALTHARAHRSAFSTAHAAKLLADEVSAGRLDKKAVQAVLDISGIRPPPMPSDLPDQLSGREAQVLCLLARGSSNKLIAARLSISPRTVQTHVMHIFEKTGIHGRAAAALYAVDSGLAKNPQFGG